MEDVLTDLPPPSRFFEEDLDNFASPSPPLPPPSLLLNPNPNPNPNPPSLLIIAISPPSLSLLRRIPHKTLIGTLILPQSPLSSNSCNIFSVDRHPSPTAILVSLNLTIPQERSRAAAKALLGEIPAGRVLILDSIKNCGSRLSADEAAGFKLETTAERRGGDRLVPDWELLPSGSVMGGIGAAAIGECQMRGWKAAMCATWPESGWGTAAAELKLGGVMRGLGFDVDGEDDGGVRVSSRFYSELYV